MRIRVPAGKEKFQYDVSGSLLSPGIGMKGFVHLEAKSSFLLLLYCTCFNCGPEWAKPQLGRSVVCPSLWKTLLFVVPSCEQDVYLPLWPVACLSGEGVLGIVSAHPGAPGPIPVTPDLWVLQDATKLSD